MQLKNLNPRTGLRQVTNGFICVSRLQILTKIKNREIKPNELGYFLIFLLSTDWDVSEHRKGFIRFTLTDLSKIWGIPLSTLSSQLPKLIAAGLIEKQDEILKIVDFNQYTFSIASQNAKQILTNENIDDLFENLINNNEIRESYQSRDDLPFKNSFKKEFSNNSNVYTKKEESLVEEKTPLNRTMADYQKIYEEGGYTTLTPEDMRWIDDNQ